MPAPTCRARVLEAKAPRRVHLGEHLTLLFENALTVQYQVQEMMRTEQIVLLGGAGEIGATLLIEIDDPAVRSVKLREWWALPEHLYLLLEDGARVPRRFDARQRGEDRVSSVQYLKFDVKGMTPVAAGVDLPGLSHEVRLTPEQRRALSEDLAS